MEILKQQLRTINMQLALFHLNISMRSISTIDINGVEATAENVLQEKYSLSRPFLFVYKEGQLTDAGQRFIDFILSEDGQLIAAEAGAIPIK